MEHKIGEIVTLLDGRKAEVMKGECENELCALWDKTECIDKCCYPDERTDGEQIFYKEIKETDIELFENAKFGDRFRTREGFLAIYVKCEDKDFNSHPHNLIVEDTKKIHYYNDFGSVLVKYDQLESSLYDIIGKLKEPPLSPKALDGIKED